MRKIFALMLLVISTTLVHSQVPYSASAVKIPHGMEFLADWTQTGYTISGDVVDVSYRITNGVASKVPSFLYRVDANGNPVAVNTTMKEFASAFVNENETPTVNVNADGSRTISYNTYTSTWTSSGTSATKTTVLLPTGYRVQFPAWGGETVGMTLQQAIQYFGADFKIETFSSPNGLQYASVADPNTRIDGSTTYFGIVSTSRVIRDCANANMYSTNRRTGVVTMIGGQYRDINRSTTVNTLPVKFWKKTVETYVRMPITNSILPFLRYENGKVINNTFVNKALFSGGRVANPAGYEFTPTYVLMLTNGGADQTAGGYSLRSRAQSVVHLTSFDEFNVVMLSDGREGYIDAASKTIFINPNKKAIVRLEVTQARIGDIMAKTYAWEWAIRIPTNVNSTDPVEGSRYFERL